MSRYQELLDEAKTNINEITVDELSAFLEQHPETVLIDIREVQETVNGVIPGAAPIPRGILEGNIERVVPNNNTPVILYCAGGGRSALSADSLQNMGYTNVYSLAGGYGAWQETQ